jgi:nucleolar protein 56
MNKTVYTNLFGTFMFKENKIIAKKLFKNLTDRKNKLKYEKEYLKKNVEKADSDFVFPKSKEFNELFYKFNMAKTKKDLIKSVRTDNLINQAINNIDDLNKVINLLSKRLREWYSLYFPELDLKVEDHEIYAQYVTTKKRTTMEKEFGMRTIGSDLSDEDVKQTKSLAKEILSLIKLRESEKNYIEEIMSHHCPNLKEVATTTIAAELIEHARSLENLAGMTSSTIQLLGAEKALFRHLMNKRAGCPKHGIIINHPLVASARHKDKGKAARHLASAISIAAKVDFFHKGALDNTQGKLLVEKLNKQLKK